MPSFEKNKIDKFQFPVKQDSYDYISVTKQHNTRQESANQSLKSAQLLREREKFGEAILLLQQLLKENSSNSRINLQLALTLQSAGRKNESERYFLSTLALAPGMIIAVLGLSEIWRESGKIENAIDLLKSYLIQLPNNSLLIGEYANICHAKRHYTDAIAFNNMLGVVDPQNGNALANIAESLSELQRHEESLCYIEKALKLNTESDQLKLNRAFTLLTLKRFREGWEAHEARLAIGIPDSPKRLINIPLWSGEPLDGKNILVCSEQGLGDQFFFGAYVPKLCSIANCVTIETDPRLVPLFTRTFPKARVHPFSRRLIRKRPTFNYNWVKKDNYYPEFYVNLASLPMVFHENHTYPVAAHGYLQPAEHFVKYWQTKIALLSNNQPVIGLFWRSGLFSAERRHFYPSIDRFGPILKLEGVCFLSLQFDDDKEDRDFVLRKFGVKLIKLNDVDLRNDLDQLAAILSRLRGVVSPSTTTANLAASVGTPTIIVNRNMDWTPMIKGRDAILNKIERIYPRKADDWQSVFQQTKERVETWL